MLCIDENRQCVWPALVISLLQNNWEKKIPCSYSLYYRQNTCTHCGFFKMLSHTLHLAAKFSPNVGESGTENTLKTNTPFSLCLSAFNLIVTCNYVFVALCSQRFTSTYRLCWHAKYYLQPLSCRSKKKSKKQKRKHFVCCECAWGDLHFWCSVRPVIQKCAECAD